MTFAGKTFRDKSLSLDGKRFDNCTFERCDLDFAGGLPPVLDGCRFLDCRFTFSGAAANTLGFLSGMHGGGFGGTVEATFQGIRDGAFKQLPAQPLAEPRRPAAPPDIHPLGLRIPRIVKVEKN